MEVTTTAIDLEFLPTDSRGAQPGAYLAAYA